MELIISDKEIETTKQWNDMEIVKQAMREYTNKHGGGFIYAHIKSPVHISALKYVMGKIEELLRAFDLC
jgi:hypothetical protein